MGHCYPSTRCFRTLQVHPLGTPLPLLHTLRKHQHLGVNEHVLVAAAKLSVVLPLVVKRYNKTVIKRCSRLSCLIQVRSGHRFYQSAATERVVTGHLGSAAPMLGATVYMLGAP